jgi:hypothetical protein
MNERIREIKESTCPEIDWEARHYVELNNGEKKKWMDEWFEKFAELIVLECAEICLDMAAKCAGVNDGALAKDCAHWIKKDFGIEE